MRDRRTVNRPTSNMFLGRLLPFLLGAALASIATMIASAHVRDDLRGLISASAVGLMVSVVGIILTRVSRRALDKTQLDLEVLIDRTTLGVLDALERKRVTVPHGIARHTTTYVPDRDFDPQRSAVYRDRLCDDTGDLRGLFD